MTAEIIRWLFPVIIVISLSIQLLLALAFRRGALEWQVFRRYTIRLTLVVLSTLMMIALSPAIFVNT